MTQWVVVVSAADQWSALEIMNEAPSQYVLIQPSLSAIW